MTRRHRNTEPFPVQEERPTVQEAPVIPEASKQKVAEGNEPQAATVKKKRVRHRQTVKRKVRIAFPCQMNGDDQKAEKEFEQIQIDVSAPRFQLHTISPPGVMPVL